MEKNAKVEIIIISLEKLVLRGPLEWSSDNWNDMGYLKNQIQHKKLG